MDTGVCRERREQRLVLHPLLRRRERRLVLDVAEGEIATHGRQRIRVTVLAVDRLDEDVFPIVVYCEEGRRVLPVRGDGRQRPHRIATSAEHALHEAGVELAARGPDPEVDERADGRAERDSADDVERQLRAHEHSRDGDQPDRRPRRPPGRPRQIGSYDRDEGGGDGRVRGRVAEVGEPMPSDDYVGRQFRGPTPLDEPAHDVRHDIASASRETGGKCHPPAPGGKREGHDDDHRGRRAELHHDFEGDAQGVGEIVHEPETVDLEGTRAIHARDAHARGEDRAPQPEPEQIGRMAFARAQARM